MWFGQSLAGVAAYLADAPTRNLDLITGDPETHDWWPLMGGWHLPGAAAPLGHALHFLALLLTLGSVALWDDLQPTAPLR